jgi:hypothetical protein
LPEKIRKGKEQEKATKKKQQSETMMGILNNRWKTIRLGGSSGSRYNKGVERNYAKTGAENGSHSVVGGVRLGCSLSG